ncbi:hypothetical protein KKJ06_16835 [Xenorhabdus bovienii]|nr:hypothetical protein [Xenorhabdus bovienii]MDE9557046.1 hypothetical protein [Xenorhabdus bovienii]
MQKIGDVTNTADGNGEYTNGNVAAGVAPTILDAVWFNTIQREIINVISKAGIKLNKNNDAQLSEAIFQLISNGKIVLTDNLGNSSGLAVSQKLTNQVNDNANTRLEKSKNGADIPDPKRFVENLGLVETVERAKNAVSANGGDYPGKFNFSQVGTLPRETSRAALVALDERPVYSLVAQTQYQWHGGTIGTGLIRGHSTNTEGYAIDINHHRALMVTENGTLTVARVALTDYSNFDERYDARYIIRFRQGREQFTKAALDTSQSRVPDGHFMTGIGNYSNGAWVGVNELLHRPIQCLINGQWRNIDIEVLQ